MNRSAAVRTDVAEEAVRTGVSEERVLQPELVPAAAAPAPSVEEMDEYERVGDELKEDDRQVVEGWVQSLRAKAGEVEATREAWETLATVAVALVFGVVLCYFLAHL